MSDPLVDAMASTIWRTYVHNLAGPEADPDTDPPTWAIEAARQIAHGLRFIRSDEWDRVERYLNEP